MTREEVAALWLDAEPTLRRAFRARYGCGDRWRQYEVDDLLGALLALLLERPSQREQVSRVGIVRWARVRVMDVLRTLGDGQGRSAIERPAGASVGRLTPDGGTPHDEAVALRLDLGAALATLPPRHADLLRERTSGRRLREIAEEHGLTESWACWMERRAKEALRPLLEAYEDSLPRRRGRALARCAA